jgi:hypothetical protein
MPWGSVTFMITGIRPDGPLLSLLDGFGLNSDARWHYGTTKKNRTLERLKGAAPENSNLFRWCG